MITDEMQTITEQNGQLPTARTTGTSYETTSTTRRDFKTFNPQSSKSNNPLPMLFYGPLGLEKEAMSYWIIILCCLCSVNILFSLYVSILLNLNINNINRLINKKS